MAGLDHNHQTELEKQAAAPAADVTLNASESRTLATVSSGSSVIESEFKESLNQAFQTSASTSDNDHNHEKPDTGNGPTLHVSLDQVDVKSIDLKNGGGRSATFKKLTKLGLSRGDFLDPGAGNNTVIGSGNDDVIIGKGQGLNTITTGKGRDTIVLGEETTNRIFDFDPTKDLLAIDESVSLRNIVVAQGKNPGKGGLDQPLDSNNNTLIIDKSNGHILGALTFTKAESLSANNFVRVSSDLVDGLGRFGKFANVRQDGDGNTQLNGTTRRDKLIGGGGNDFLYVGDDGFKIGTAKGTGPGEFPFPNTSPGTTELNAELKGGVLRVNGTYKDFEGAPLFSQGETEIDPKATILNGSDPKALIAGFLRVPNDVEGNRISGTHLHFSPSQDSRGNFADATVIRYFENTPTSATSGTISGEFELTSEEQAAFLAGNFYVNAHTNIDVDGDGKAGFPTGENRVNFNQNTIQFTERSKFA